MCYKYFTGCSYNSGTIVDRKVVRQNVWNGKICVATSDIEANPYGCARTGTWSHFTTSVSRYSAQLPSLPPIPWTRHTIFGVHLGYEPKIAHEIKYFVLAKHEKFHATHNFMQLYGFCLLERMNIKTLSPLFAASNNPITAPIIKPWLYCIAPHILHYSLMCNCNQFSRSPTPLGSRRRSISSVARSTLSSKDVSLWRACIY